uniref:Heat shock protein 70 n=1 Tax=Panagrolaimus sp. ES5 TaxID=591445 RepID=A0AC34G699_9BILA
MAGDPEVIDYDTNAAATYPVITKIGEKRILDFFDEFSLPSTRAIHIELENTENNILTIITGRDKKEETILPTLKEFVLTVTVDTTGIYNVHYHKPSINKKVLEHLYSKAEDYNKSNNMQYILSQQMKNYSNEIDVVGIDLGATKCCVAVNRQSGMETIPLDNTGEKHLPSYVAFEEKHDKCGKIVVNRLRYFSKSAVFDTKLIIGKKFDDVLFDGSWPFKLIKINNNPVQLRDNTFQQQDYYTMIQFQGCDGEVLKYPEEISAIF